MDKRILIAEDDESLRRVIEFHLCEKGYTVLAAEDGKQALGLFRRERPDLVLTDMAMPGLGGLDLLREVKRLEPAVPVIIITAFGSIESAVEAMRDGAFDYITKPISNEELSLVVQKALEYKALKDENVRLRLEVKDRFKFENIIGSTPQMKHLYELMGRVAARDVTILIQGETGTGKELVARAIHYNSTRSAGPFVPINCGAIPKDLVESELFGSRKGAYTGATRDRSGRFEQANRGTLFLDEVAELSPDLQVKLLRALEERLVTPLGGEKPIPVDIRIIAASNRSLETAVQEGEFREDIYYRLNVVSILVPPLRERLDDIPLLVQHFLAKFGQPRCEVDGKVWAVLSRYRWPGNVRQLENVIERALVLQQAPGRLAVGDLPPEVVTPSHRPFLAVGEFPEQGIDLEENEKLLIQMALARADNNQTRAAELLGISRHVLIYRMQKYGIR